MLNGLLLVDKPTGITSHDVVAGLRKTLKTKQIGHAGTLDPLASGLLICLIGEATKLSNYVMAEDKRYRVGVRLGVVTDSGDITGRVIAECSQIPRAEKIRQAASALKGELLLSVPKVSAIKVQGKKLYDYAREGQDVAIPQKIMRIDTVECLRIDGAHAEFELSCSKGTYIRSWAEKLGEGLGVGATVESLVRLKSGRFELKDAVGFEKYVETQETGPHSFVPMERALDPWPELRVKGRDEKLLRNGQIPRGLEIYLRNLGIQGGVQILAENGELLAILMSEQTLESIVFKIARVFKG